MKKREILIVDSKQEFLEEIVNYQAILTPFSIKYNTLNDLTPEDKKEVITFDEILDDLKIYNEFYETDFTKNDYENIINISANKIMIHSGPNIQDYTSRNGRFSLYKEVERKHIHSINHAQNIEFFLNMIKTKKTDSNTLVYAPIDVQKILNVQD
jgi:hypothetical protein